MLKGILVDLIDESELCFPKTYALERLTSLNLSGFSAARLVLISAQHVLPIILLLCFEIPYFIYDFKNWSSVNIISI